MRRRAGVGAIQKKRLDAEKFRDKGSELAEHQLEQLSSQLQTFQTNLEVNKMFFFRLHNAGGPEKSSRIAGESRFTMCHVIQLEQIFSAYDKLETSVGGLFQSWHVTSNVQCRVHISKFCNALFDSIE